MIDSITAPERNRIVENAAGSITPSRSAIRHRTEFAANATRAITVNAMVLGRSVMRGAALVIDDRIGFDLDEPLGIDEADHLHHSVGGTDVAKDLAVHGGNGFPIVDAGGAGHGDEPGCTHCPRDADLRLVRTSTRHELS